MDDPISALDANVKKRIFKNLFVKHLQNKTRVLVTHAVDFLALVDRVIVLAEGKVVIDGKYEDIKGNPYLD
jgi:ABC-type bacteriocin/lantibiotic exporter with double-glycine peptidase domain